MVGCVSSKSTQIIGDPIPATTISQENLHEYNLDEISTNVAIPDSTVSSVKQNRGNR